MTDYDPDDEEFTGKARGFPDSLRRFLLTGASALFMSEEGIRQAVTDMRLPKEAFGFFVQQADKTRKEVYRVFSAEIKEFLRTMDLPTEIRKALAGMKVEFKAEVRFREDGTPEVELKETKFDPKASDAADEGDKESV